MDPASHEERLRHEFEVGDTADPDATDARGGGAGGVW
jgi:hypothetical protein